MHRRRILVPLALAGSVGMALTPALAEASSAAQSGAAQLTSKAVAPLSADLASSFKTFSSPAGKSVRVHKAVASATSATAGPASGPSPDLGISLNAEQMNAFGISLEVTPADYNYVSGDNLTLTITWGDGTDSTVADSTDQPDWADHTYSRLGAYTITVTANDNQGDIATNTVTGAQTAGSEFVPYTPTRILDTRNAIGAPTAPIGPGDTLKLQVVGAGLKTDPIPSGVSAVVLNVTAAGSTSNGLLSVYPDDEPGILTPPATSNVNYGPGQIVPNLVIVPVGPDGVVDIYNGSKGKTEVLADVSGYFLPTNADEYVAITPSRILDTRKTVSIPADGSLNLTVDGAPGLPKSGVDAIAANLTVAGSSTNGFISAYPEAGSVPNVSNVNYAPHQIVPDMAIVPVNTSNGEITIHNSSKGWVQVLVDVFGYFTETQGVARESAYLPATAPFRWLDTRDVFGKHEPLQGDRPSAMPFTNDPALTGMVFNATIVGPASNGFLAVYRFDTDDPGAVPGTSNVNYGPGQIVANLVIASPGTTTAVVDNQNNYEIGLYLASHGQSDLILDSFGEFVDD